MTHRYVRVLVLAALTGALGCQDYNFNPVGHCLIQPGTKRFTLSSVSTADILFVIDDSNSMALKQVGLGQSFSTFIDKLNVYNLDRASHGLEPIDFHIAVTTTAIYDNNELGSSYACRNTCTGLSGNYCCTSGNAPLTIPRECCQADDPQCAFPGNTCSGGNSCRTDCQGFSGLNVCCSGDGATVERSPVSCATVGDTCGNWRIQYPPSCAASSGGVSFGVGSANAVFPHGSFVSMPGNPRVLHFDKQLYPQSTPCPSPPATCDTGQVCSNSVCRQSCTNTCAAGFKCVSGACEPTNNAGYTQQQLESFFAKVDGSSNWSGNAIVGVCGSGQEQGIRAAKLAIAKARAGTQGLLSGEWPHGNSKLVVVFVGDEDDCSSPEDPVQGITLGLTDVPGSDACVRNDGGKEYDVKTYLADYLSSFRTPALLGGGFIEGTNDPACNDLTTCSTLAPGPATCGYAVGFRFLSLASDIANGGSDVVAGPVCSSDFGPILGRLADIVKPPSVLTLPTPPASSQLALLRIVDEDGNNRKTCTGPAPAGTLFSDAEASYDWWFVLTDHPNTTIAPLDDGSAVAVSKYVYINHTLEQCEANPGETYSLDYLGIVPQPTLTNPTGGCHSVAECVTYLGGDTSKWQCCDSSAACSTQTNPVTLSTLGSCLCAGSEQ